MSRFLTWLQPDLLKLRLEKLLYAFLRPSCWPALRRGVVPSVEHRSALRGLAVDGIVDAGANRGQFSLLCRCEFPNTRVWAFEPIPHEADVFERIHGGGQTRLFRLALGDRSERALLHLSNRLDSSSLLDIGGRQAELFSGTHEVGKLEVEVRRLEDMAGHFGEVSEGLLKIDVQGFELMVLRGAGSVLSRFRYIYVECSEVVLYEGQCLRQDVCAFLEGRGFQLAGRFNPTWRGGQLIQADYLFGRP